MTKYFLNFIERYRTFFMRYRSINDIFAFPAKLFAIIKNEPYLCAR